MDWLNHFERNRARRLGIPWERGIAVEAHLREPLIRSLQRFQVGESGDGTYLKQCAAATGDPAYMAAIGLFVAEEQEHARLLARLVQSLGGRLLSGHWSKTCFVLLRRSSGLAVELMVLLAAEMISKRYYRALYEGTHDPVLRAAFAQIRRDEEGHLAFHYDTLRRIFVPLPPSLQRLAHLVWRLFFRAVCLVVLFDHLRVLRAVGVGLGAFWCDCGLIFDQAAARIFSPPILSEVEEAI